MLFRSTTLLWCDACIVPVRPLEPLWEKIERDGYWFCANGWSNYEWTAALAYWEMRKLFAELCEPSLGAGSSELSITETWLLRANVPTISRRCESRE